ncbi:hypothetical protein PSV08DRAFT_9141 [Bipolaris maydis]|uniref:uncharacterized protein n=1 Tax=Cochliobolus heterostrophus TaxID=5016 RepID=UPI0024CE3EA3|nr:hypothetical protein J3E73DRAFT_8619 [Bipolaris maydis]KAJ5057667.1 hypothetical protein J3E74DRAFT_9394 [Bipolaris maydis]KAJ6268512.1 hypothetical protein PSV08DRAFT_9141 [Bipolaris maydis]
MCLSLKDCDIMNTLSQPLSLLRAYPFFFSPDHNLIDRILFFFSQRETMRHKLFHPFFSKELVNPMTRNPLRISTPPLPTLPLPLQQPRPNLYKNPTRQHHKFHPEATHNADTTYILSVSVTQRQCQPIQHVLTRPHTCRATHTHPSRAKQKQKKERKRPLLRFAPTNLFPISHSMFCQTPHATKHQAPHIHTHILFPTPSQ